METTVDKLKIGTPVMFGRMGCVQMNHIQSFG